MKTICGHCEGTGYDNRSRCMHCQGSGQEQEEEKEQSNSSKIYLIEKLYLDPMENRESRALTQKIVGYTTSVEDAERIVNNGRTFDVNDCWALKKDTAEYSYTEIQRLS